MSAGRAVPDVPSAPAAGRARFASIDLVRGVVMLLMLLDHVRATWNGGTGVDPLDPAATTPLLFLTRWITHLCAPAFALLAGAGARLALDAAADSGGPRGPAARVAARLLALRGIVVVALELFVISPARGLVPFASGIIFQVLWALGASMPLLAALRRLPAAALGLAGLAVIALHGLLPASVGATGAGAFAWNLLFSRGATVLGPRWILDVWYPLFPWVGVVLTGYWLGGLWRAEVPPRLRVRLLAALGVACVALFLALRLPGGYGDPVPFAAAPGSALRTAYSLLDAEKYPPSLQYLLMTLGPVLLSLSALDRARPAPSNPLLVFGRVPLFFYVVHVWLNVLVAALALGLLAPAGAVRGLEGAIPFRFGLGATYSVWLALALALYPACTAYGALKASRRQRWTAYL